LTRRYLSPLRYPGGKARLAPFLGGLIKSQARQSKIYVEPFAGGAGAALLLLVDEYVEAIELNDLDAGIVAFWNAVFFHTDALVERITNAKVTIREWRKQREVFHSSHANDPVERGYATFFLNRTSRSGILDARPIGGLDQAGEWSVDARFNREALAERVAYLGRYRQRVRVHHRDGLSFLRSHLKRHFADAFYYIDPPYLNNGADLYLDTMTWKDHERLADMLASNEAKWVLTYDNDRRVSKLYPKNKRVKFAIAHSAAVQHIGTEFVVFSNSLRPPTSKPVE
jgi:DNA adenine methylase